MNTLPQPFWHLLATVNKQYLPFESLEFIQSLLQASGCFSIKG